MSKLHEHGMALVRSAFTATWADVRLVEAPGGCEVILTVEGRQVSVWLRFDEDYSYGRTRPAVLVKRVVGTDAHGKWRTLSPQRTFRYRAAGGFPVHKLREYVERAGILRARGDEVEKQRQEALEASSTVLERVTDAFPECRRFIYANEDGIQIRARLTEGEAIAVLTALRDFRSLDPPREPGEG